jgi:hypothetical protein
MGIDGSENPRSYEMNSPMNTTQKKNEFLRIDPKTESEVTSNFPVISLIKQIEIE